MPDFILVGGDSVRHDAHLMPDPHRAVGDVLGSVLGLIHESFPGTVVSHGSLADAHTRVVQAVGNNDFEPDYIVRVPVQPLPPPGSAAQLAQDPQLALFAHEWLNDTVDPSQHEDLARGGYVFVCGAPSMLFKHYSLTHTHSYLPLAARSLARIHTHTHTRTHTHCRLLDMQVL